MVQIVCQHGDQRCLYATQSNYSELRGNISTDFDDLCSDFELMYIDEKAGDWMLVESQRDLDMILKLKREYILIKVLPAVERDAPPVAESQGKIGKLVITQELRKMVTFVSEAYLSRYLSKKRVEQTMKISQMILQQKMPPSRTRFAEMSPSIEKRLGFERPSRRIVRLSPQKPSAEQKISKAVNLKLVSVIEELVDQSFKQVQMQSSCKSCLIKELQIEKLICQELRKKARNSRNNPEQY